MKQYVTQANMKKSSLAVLLRYVLDNGPSTRREIQQVSGFSWGTVSENAAELIQRGYLREQKEAPSGGAGRTGYRLVLDGENVVSVGLDVNLSGMTAEIVGFDGIVKHTIHRDCAQENQQAILAEMQSLCDEAMALCEDKYRVMSIGVAFQGAVDNKSGVSMRFPAAGGWIPCSIKQLFEEKYRIYTYVDHDPKCMLYAKAHTLREEKELSDSGDLMLVRIDESIGLSVMLDGHICEDVDKMELAHTLAEYEGLPCRCGRKGCLDAYASIHGICSRCGVSFEEILANREKYAAVLDDAIKYLAIALHNVAMLFYPDRIILTGSCIARDESFIERLRPVFEAMDGASGRRNIELLADGNISAAYGAALKSVKEAIRELHF